MKKKECPSCAMDVNDKSRTCPVCGYEFPASSRWLQWVAMLLILMFLLIMLI